MLELLSILFYLFFFYAVAWLFFYFQPRYISKTPWQHFFDGIAFSSADFYAAMVAGIRERTIPQVACTTELLSEAHILSPRREYLKITQAEYVFYICAAPYGTGTFVSCWLCTKEEGWLNRIPVISKLFGKDRGNKTFYQMDTEAMCRTSIQTTLMATVDKFTSAKGLRGLTDTEKQYSQMEYKR
jgi:hypothetical protein